MEELLAELDEMIGLARVKKEIHRQVALLTVEKMRDGGGPQGAADEPAPDLRRQPRHRQDDGRSAHRRDLPRPRAAPAGPARRGRPQRARRRLRRADRDEDRRGLREGHGRGALHRRGLRPDRRPVRRGGGQHPRQGDGGPPRGARRHRRRLSRPDGRASSARTPAWQADSRRRSSSTTTPTRSCSPSSTRSPRAPTTS